MLNKIKLESWVKTGKKRPIGQYANKSQYDAKYQFPRNKGKIHKNKDEYLIFIKVLIHQGYMKIKKTLCTNNTFKYKTQTPQGCKKTMTNPQ